MDVTNPIFTDEAAARTHLEALLWPNGPTCPHCGEVEAYTRLEGKSGRPGLFQCNSCRKQFTVTIGTIFEDSKIPLHKWVFGFWLMTSSKKGCSAHQMMRMLGLGSYRTAWFMAHRIREAMTEGYFRKDPLGGKGKVVEADETYVGANPQKDTRVQKKLGGRRGGSHKLKIYSLVERGGKVRSFHVRDASTMTVMGIMQDQVDSKTAIATDEAAQYNTVRFVFTGGHGTVNHSAKQYVYGDAHTNTVENYFSILKRGLTGVYQHVSAHHLRRYANEFDFRYNNRSALGIEDAERMSIALAGAAGKRLTYQGTGKRSRD